MSTYHLRYEGDPTRPKGGGSLVLRSLDPWPPGEIRAFDPEYTAQIGRAPQTSPADFALLFLATHNANYQTPRFVAVDPETGDPYPTDDGGFPVFPEEQPESKPAAKSHKRTTTPDSPATDKE